MTNGFTVKAARKRQHCMTDVKLPLIDVSTLICVLDEISVEAIFVLICFSFTVL